MDGNDAIELFDEINDTLKAKCVNQVKKEPLE